MELQEYRRKLKERATQAPAITKLFQDVNKKSAAYIPFMAGSERRQMLWIRVSSSNKTSTQIAPAYRCLDMMHTDGNGLMIYLRFPTLQSVVIFGFNLYPLYEKLLTHEVEWIQEFDPKLWKEPARTEPCVSGIEVRRPGDMTLPPHFTLQ